MASDSLNPPNSYYFSDEVISTVAQRVGSIRDQGSCGSSYHSPQLNQLKRTHPSASSGASVAKNMQKYGKLIKEIVLKRDLHRERCRTNQARYRKKQQKYLTDLEAEVEQLRDETQTLEKQRQVISFGVPTKETVWNIVAEYFRLFRHGYIAPMFYSELRGVEGTRQSHMQLEFLQATMAIDVMDGNGHGVDAHLENWRLFSLYHGDVQLQLERLEKGPGNSTTKTGVTITEITLRNLYLHLLVSESDDGKWSPLAYRLLDQRLEMDGSIRFVWDPSTGRVTSLQITTNLLAPMLRLVGSVDEVARVFDGAFITPDGQLL